MKKSLLSLSAAALALTGMAASPFQMSPTSNVSLDRSQALQTNIKGLNPQLASSRLMKAPAEEEEEVTAPEIIYEAEGTVQIMTTVGSGYYVYLFWVMEYQDQEVSNHVVYGDNDEVYFWNLIPNAATNTYLKGVKNGDKVELPMGQFVTWTETEVQGEDGEVTYERYGLQLAVLDFVEATDPETGEDASWWFNNPDVESVTFTVNEDGSMVMDALEDGQLLGFIWSDDSSWSGYGASDLSLTPFNDVIVDLPEDYEAVPDFWTMISDGYFWGVTWSQGAEEVYFQGLADSMPEAWVKGSLEMVDDTTAIIRIAQNQYVGDYSGIRIFTKAFKIVYDESGKIEDAEMMPDDYEYELVWDFESMTITPKNPEVSLVYNAASDRLYYLQILGDYKLITQDGPAEGTPADPYNLSFENTMDIYGYDGFFFTVPCLNTEGEVLDSDSLYYVVYVDGEEWEFDAEEYGMSESITEVPWNFSESWYLNYDLGGAMREVDFFVEGITTLGVQSVYKYNGEETRSEIVSIELDDPTSVIAVGDKKVASVKYYGIDGREVANPAAGIFVKRVTFEDGTVATFKKAVR